MNQTNHGPPDGPCLTHTPNGSPGRMSQASTQSHQGPCLTPEPGLKTQSPLPSRSEGRVKSGLIPQSSPSSSSQSLPPSSASSCARGCTESPSGGFVKPFQCWVSQNARLSLLNDIHRLHAKKNFNPESNNIPMYEHGCMNMYEQGLP